MSRKLTGRFDVQSVVPVDPTHWTIGGSYFDETGTFGPGDVAIGHRMYAYSSLDNTLRYRISSISVASNPMTFVVEWDDAGTEIEPPTGIAAITEVSATKLLPDEPSFSQQLLDEPLVAGIRSQMNRTLVEGISGGGGSSNVKQMVAGAALSSGKPISKRPDGKIIQTDSDGADARNYVGFSLQSAAADGDLVNVQLVGANIAGALTGLGFASGSQIFLDEVSGGLTDDPGTFTGANDVILKVGIADCAAGTASGTATDLIMFSEEVARD